MPWPSHPHDGRSRPQARPRCHPHLQQLPLDRKSLDAFLPLELKTDDRPLGSDAAVKDLTFAILMSNNPDGSVVVNANWDKVAETMTSWGYGFTKSAMCKLPALHLLY